MCITYYRLELSACNVESTGSSLVLDSYCVGTLSIFFSGNCSALCNMCCSHHCICASPPLLDFLRYQRSILLYCICFNKTTILGIGLLYYKRKALVIPRRLCKLVYKHNTYSILHCM